MVLPYLHIRCQEYTPNTEGDHLNVTSNNLQHSLYKVGLFLYKHTTTLSSQRLKGGKISKQLLERRRKQEYHGKTCK